MIIGGAFGGIVKSLVDNIIMPLISLVMPAEHGYTEWAWTVPGTTKSIPYGQFLGDVVNFLIIALVLFIFIVKFLGWILRTKKEAPPPALTKDQELLDRDPRSAEESKVGWDKLASDMHSATSRMSLIAEPIDCSLVVAMRPDTGFAAATRW